MTPLSKLLAALDASDAAAQAATPDNGLCDILLANTAAFRVLVEAVEAAQRIVFHKYVDWSLAGGVNECAHGYSEGIPCYKCDCAKVSNAIQRAAELLAVKGDEGNHDASKNPA